jgi:hypothetical protein
MEDSETLGMAQLEEGSARSHSLAPDCPLPCCRDPEPTTGQPGALVWPGPGR